MSVGREDPVHPPGGKRERLARLTHQAGMLPLLGGLRACVRHDVRILAYHRVLDVAHEHLFDFDLDLVSASPEQFRTQMQLIKRRYRPLRFDEWIEAHGRGRRLPRNSVLVTFDDGYDDNHRIAFPILRELGMSAMFFVATGHIDDGRPYAYDWLVHMLLATRADSLTAPELGIVRSLPIPAGSDRPGRRRLAAALLQQIKRADGAAEQAFLTRLADEWNMPRTTPHADCRPMGWDDLRTMRAAGMEIGSHAVSHRMLSKLDDAELARELGGSRQRLRDELGFDADVIAYPVGGPRAYDARVMAASRAAGYRMACSYIAGTNPLPLADTHELRRLPVERDMDTAWFAAATALPELFSYPFVPTTRELS